MRAHRLWDPAAAVPDDDLWSGLVAQSQATRSYWQTVGDSAAISQQLSTVVATGSLSYLLQQVR